MPEIDYASIARDILAGGAPDQPDEVHRQIARDILGADQPPVVLPPEKPERGKIYSGGIVSDVLDTMSALQYAGAGAALGLQKHENPLVAAWHGVQNRTSWEDVLTQAGVEEGPARTVFGIAGDILLDPTWIVTPAKVFNLLGKVEAFNKAGTVIKDVVGGSRIGQEIRKALVYAPDLPESIRELHNKFLDTLGVDKQAITNMFRKIQNLGEDGKEYFTAIARAEPAEKSALMEAAREAGINTTKLSEAVVEHRALEQSIGKRLVTEGVMTPEAYKVFENTHLKTVYTRFEDIEKHIKTLREEGNPMSDLLATQLETTLAKGRARGTRGKLFSFREMKEPAAEVTDAMKKELGEITDAGYRAAKSTLTGASAAAEAEFLNSVAKIPGLESETIKEGYTALGISPRLGPMKGKIVPTPVADFLNQTLRSPGKWEQLIRGPLGWWKMGKVVASPAAQIRNFIGNLGLLNFAGVPLRRLPDLYVKALDAIAETRGVGKGLGIAREEFVQLAGVIRGSMAGSFIHQELDRVLSVMNSGGKGFFGRIKNLGEAGLLKASDFYRLNEVLGKTAAGIYAMEKGMPLETAVRFGEKALFNYAEVPKAVDFLRRNGLVPFASFGYFATDATARAIWQRPAVVSKYAKAIRGIEAANPDAQTERTAAPDWQKEYGQVFTPLKDKFGRHLVFDASYLIPFQDVASAAEGGIVKKLAGQFTFPTFISDLLQNKSSFTGRAIAPTADLHGSATAMKEIAVKKYIDYIYKFAMPTWMPSLLPGLPNKYQLSTGGYGYRNLNDAIQARPDVFGKEKDWKAVAIGEVFGLKTRPFDLSGEQRARVRDYKHDVMMIHTTMKRVAMDNSLTTEEKHDQIFKLKEDLINIHRGFRNEQ